MKTLIIIDMQNDFIDGALANKDAEAIVPAIADYAKSFDGNVILTRDTHYGDYLYTQEGQRLPVKHCLFNTEGWRIHPDIMGATEGKRREFLNKTSFGTLEWRGVDGVVKADELIIVGTCTDICVVSNALILKAMCPSKKVTVLSCLCAGTTKENHEAALQTMRMCQCEVL